MPWHGAPTQSWTPIWARSARRDGLQAAAELLDDFRDGVFFVGLAPIRDPLSVAAAIAHALGVKETASTRSWTN